MLPRRDVVLGCRFLGRQPGVRIDRLQPRLFPEKQAVALASVMESAVTSQVFQQYRVLHAPHAVALHTGLADSSEDANACTAIGCHLRHEWHTIKLSRGIECVGDFSEAADFDQLIAKESVGLSSCFHVIPVLRIWVRMVLVDGGFRVAAPYIGCPLSCREFKCNDKNNIDESAIEN